MKTEQEFISLITTHSGIIHKVILLYVDDVQERKDLYQEILLQAWKSFERFKGDALFSTWLYKVALNTVFSFNRKWSKQPQRLDMDQSAVEPAEDRETETDNKQQLLYLIRNLDEIDRMLITLHLDGFQNNEIAEMSGLTANNVGVKLHRIKQKLIAGMRGDIL